MTCERCQDSAAAGSPGWGHAFDGERWRTACPACATRTPEPNAWPPKPSRFLDRVKWAVYAHRTGMHLSGQGAEVTDLLARAAEHFLARHGVPPADFDKPPRPDPFDPHDAARAT